MIKAPGSKDIEIRSGVDSLDALQQERRDLMKSLTPLRAKYGSFGTIEPLRKQYVEALKSEAWAALQKSLGKQPAEWMVDADAYGSDRFKAFLDKWEAERVDLINLETTLTEIEEKIRSREIELRAYAAETMLGR